jgi:hypothetical protein
MPQIRESCPGAMFDRQRASPPNRAESLAAGAFRLAAAEWASGWV